MTSASLTPMLDILDVKSTLECYDKLGFTVDGTHEEDGEVQWAMLNYGEGRIMFNRREQSSVHASRAVDLYIHTTAVDDLHSRLQRVVPIHRAPETTFYGMREFSLRDPNGFMITFGMDTDA